MDVGTISIILVLSLIVLLAIGMPLGFASAFLAVLVMVMKFEPTLLTNPECYIWACEEMTRPGMLTGRPGTGPLYIITQKIFDLMTDYVLISVPLFIFMAALLERSGIAKQMYDSLEYWLSSVCGGIAIVTSIMAVIMAAMSGIIGGEVVLLGLIALPQMLRLGYNQNLAIGTICASGSLGTMIPPSIVLIINGLITETSIKALFTGAFIPGFMLATFIIIYIVVRTQMNPSLAPLPEGAEDPEVEALGVDTAPKLFYGANLLAMLGLFAAWWTGAIEAGGALMILALLYGVLWFLMTMTAKGQAFLGFLAIVNAVIATVLLLRWIFFWATGRAAASVTEGEDPISLGMPADLPFLLILLAVPLAAILFALGPRRTMIGWQHGKGLVAPMSVVGVVMGSIYGGITGITEAAGMGALAVFIFGIMLRYTTGEWLDLIRGNLVGIGVTIAAIIALAVFVPGLVLPESWDFRGEFTFILVSAVLLWLVLRLDFMRALLWDALMRTLRSTGTIIWVTIGAAALAGAYTLAGGPKYIAALIVGSEMPTMMVLLAMMVILLFMGAFMDWVGIVLLIIPVFLPIVKALPIDEIGFIGQLEPRHVSIWFGVLFCMNMQVSFLSPPFGPAAFYLKSVAPPHISLTDIFRGFLPFICVQLVALTVLLIWPGIVTILL